MKAATRTKDSTLIRRMHQRFDKTFDRINSMLSEYAPDYNKETFRKAYEFGFNVRANLNFKISQYDVISGSIGSGPHYLDYENDRQNDGFIFSDYFLASYIRYFELKNRFCNFKIEIGYRHISNAGIEKPNGGISNFLVGLGFNTLLNSKKHQKSH